MAIGIRFCVLFILFITVIIPCYDLEEIDNVEEEPLIEFYFNDLTVPFLPTMDVIWSAQNAFFLDIP